MFRGVFVGPTTKPAEAGRKSPIPSAPASLHAGLGRYKPRKPPLLSSVLPPFLRLARQRRHLGGNTLPFIALGKHRRTATVRPSVLQDEYGPGHLFTTISRRFPFNRWTATDEAHQEDSSSLPPFPPWLCLSLLPAKQETKESLPPCPFLTHLLLRLSNKLISAMFFVRSAATLRHKRVILLYRGKY